MTKKRFSASQISAIRVTGIARVVTWQNFREFFGADGRLLDSVKDSALILQGKFDGDELGVRRIIFDRPITIVGDFKVQEAVLKEMAMEIVSGGVTVDGLTMKASMPLGDLIGIRASGVSVCNMKIEYHCGEESSNAINISGEETISDVVVRNNKIDFVSHVPDDKHHATAINMDNAKDLVVDRNRIRVSIPALFSKTHSREYFMMGLSSVNAIRICETGFTLVTDNTIRVKVNGIGDRYITCHALYIAGSEAILISGNSITLKDNLTSPGDIIAICGIQCGYSKDIRFMENRFDLSTRGGKSMNGSLHAINHTDCVGTEIKRNTFYCNSHGPVSALFLTCMMGKRSDVSIVGNSIEVSGYSADESPYALVSGVEMQNTVASVRENRIIVSNKNKAYSPDLPVVGVGYLQRLAGEVSFVVRDNVIRTNGEYTVFTCNTNVRKVIVKGNRLTAAKRRGDDSVCVDSAKGFVVENPRQGRRLPRPWNRTGKKEI